MTPILKIDIQIVCKRLEARGPRPCSRRRAHSAPPSQEPLCPEGELRALRAAYDELFSPPAEVNNTKSIAVQHQTFLKESRRASGRHFDLGGPSTLDGAGRG
jgi:hypothetical protein